MKKLFLTIILFSIIYIPIVHNSETYDTSYLSCQFDLHDSWGIRAGTVTAWIQVEYHPTGPIRLIQFFDRYEPNPTYRLTYFKWYGIPANSLFEVQHVWTEPPITDWQGTYTETLSSWRAITQIGESVRYVLNPVAFKQGHYKYPIICVKVPYEDDDDED